jgi:predicted nuclease of predicted toxin-antitoxin system
MKILIDMNISPLWVEVLQGLGWEAVHWSTIGNRSAPDAEILDYAKQHGYAVLTHDLDFSAILAVTRAVAPSVIQVRTQDVLSEQFRDTLTGALRQFESELAAGAMIVVEETRSRARVLPLT